MKENDTTLVEELARVNEQLRTNIAKLERSGEALRESEAFVLAVMENLPIGIAVNSVDPAVNFSYMNDNFLKCYRTTRSALADPNSFWEAVYEDPEFREEIKRRVLDDCASGDPKRMRWNGVPITRKGEETTYVSAMNTPIPSKGLMVSTVWDVTAHMRAEEEQRKLDRKVQHAQRLESLGMLAGGIAHDFNNILMAVLGHAELAMVKLSPLSPARGALAEIVTAAHHAADLCRQMLTYSGRTSGPVARIGLRELVEEMAHLLKTAISKKAILNLNLDHDLLPIQGDPSQIRQILMNLIINASESIGDRSGVITVSAGATRCDREYLESTELGDAIPPGLYMHLEVADTGCGMDARTKERIFEPFFSTKFAGRGLGLAAALGIVRAHKGALKVYSEPGRGTTFKILFPALEEKVSDEKPSAPTEWRGKGTVLLVDDEQSLCALGARMLEHLGFHVLTASDGREAVDLYRKRPGEIDLVLMDLTMPHMDGGEAFGELRRINPDIRVILSSGYSRDDVAGRFAGKNLAGVLQKPYTIAKLTEALSAVMPGREA
ncbi:MAG: response regulator [Deltaproteobacteria bacterium]|nr:MAG: response regulator [Deltaproteobacteria bacterium]